MGTKNKPGKFDCHAKAFPDEPTFVLLGRDPQMPWLLLAWAAGRNERVRAYLGAPNDMAKIEEALFLAAKTYRYWRLRDAALAKAAARVEKAKGRRLMLMPSLTPPPLLPPGTAAGVIKARKSSPRARFGLQRMRQEGH